MLTVRDEQIEVFERLLFGDMEQRVERAIAAAFPEFSETKPGSDFRNETRPNLGSVVTRGIEGALKFDIDDGPDVAAFIALGLALHMAPQSEELGSWIHACLDRPTTSGPTKLRMIESRLRALASEDRGVDLIAQRVALAREQAAL